MAFEPAVAIYDVSSDISQYGKLAPADLVQQPELAVGEVLRQRFNNRLEDLRRGYADTAIASDLGALALSTDSENVDGGGMPVVSVTAGVLRLVSPDRARRDQSPQPPAMAFTKGPTPMIDQATGDMAWFADDEQRFGLIEPEVVPERQIEVEIPPEQWSLEDVEKAIRLAMVNVWDETLGKPQYRQAAELLRDVASPTHNAAEWWHLSGKRRKEVLDRQLERILKEKPFNETKVQDLYPKQIINAPVGLRVEEYDENTGEIRDDFQIIYYKKPGGRPGEYCVCVKCAGGGMKHYDFGADNRYLLQVPGMPGATELPGGGGGLIKKPVIYIWTKKATEVSVGLDFTLGDVVVEYPQRSEDNKWHVFAEPGGTLKSMDKKKEYKYLFWEGQPDVMPEYDMSEGFCVSGDNAVEFLEEKLSILGLNDVEKEDFITYWYPVMKRNKFNVVKFLAEEYTDTAKLDISPKPDTLIRVFMAFKASAIEVDIKEQELNAITRKGYTVVEWGGVNLDERVK